MGYEDEFDTDVKKGDDLKPPKIERQDLDERLLVIFPISTDTAESTLPTSKGKPYTRVFADVIVMDGTVSRAFRDAGATEFPFTIRKFMFTDWQIVQNLKDKVGQAVLARVESRPSSKGNGRSYGIERVDFEREPEALLKAAVQAKRAHVPSTMNDPVRAAADEARSEFDEDEIPF